MFSMSFLKDKFPSKCISVCESKVKEQGRFPNKFRGIQLFHHNWLCSPIAQNEDFSQINSHPKLPLSAIHQKLSSHCY